MRRTRLWMLALLALLLGAAGCDQGDDDDGGGAADTDTDTATDTGTGEECVAPFDWGDSWATGEVIANWQLNGYIDADGDGVVETDAVDFDMDTIHCRGLDSVVLAIADTT